MCSSLVKAHRKATRDSIHDGTEKHLCGVKTALLVQGSRPFTGVRGGTGEITEEVDMLYRN